MDVGNARSSDNGVRMTCEQAYILVEYFLDRLVCN